MKTLDKQITKGIGWTSFASFSNQGLRLLLKLVLAKILLPEHYGLIGMASVVISFVALITELGMGAALIQKSKGDISGKDYNTAFWTNLGVSVAGFVIILVAVGPIAAWFYDEAILIELIPVLALPIILDALYLIPKVQLSRAMNFKPQAIREVVSVLIAGILSIYLALEGYGAWALAFNGIITSLVSIFLYYFNVAWRPGFEFDKASFKSLFGFGGYVMGERMFSFFTANIDYILIGKLIGSSALGVYTLAFILTDAFRKQFLNIISRVLYPAYSSIQHDLAQLRTYFLGVIKINGLFLFPIMTFMIVMAEPIIVYFFGDKWSDAVFPLRILSLAVIIHVLGGTTTTIMRSMGKANLIMYLSIFTTLFITVPAIALGAFYGGINGVAIGVLVNKILSYLIYQKYIYRALQINIMQVIKQFIGLTMICTLIGVALLGVSMVPFTKLFGLCIGFFVTLVMYGGYLWLFERELLRNLQKITSRKSKSKKNKTALMNNV